MVFATPQSSSSSSSSSCNNNNSDHGSVSSSLTSSNSYPELRIGAEGSPYRECEPEPTRLAHTIVTVIPPFSSAHSSEVKNSNNNATSTDVTVDSTSPSLPQMIAPALAAAPPLIARQTALLIVDVQPQYWSLCPAVRRDFPDFPDNMRQLIRTCRDRNAHVLWVYADYRFDTSPWLKQFARLHNGRIPSEVHFDDKSGWEEFAKPIVPDEPIIAKSSWSCTSQTQLLDLLKRAGVDTVLVCGLITSVCVQHSAFGVFEAGYRTVLVTDACADRGRERHKAALALYGDYMYELKTVQNVKDELLIAKDVEEKEVSYSASASTADETDDGDSSCANDDVNNSLLPARKRVKLLRTTSQQ